MTDKGSDLRAMIPRFDTNDLLQDLRPIPLAGRLVDKLSGLLENNPEMHAALMKGAFKELSMKGFKFQASEPFHQAIRLMNL